MDRKSVIVLAISFLLLFSWPVLVNKLYPPVRVPFSTNALARATNTVAGTNNPRLEAAPATNASPALPLTRPDAPEELLVHETSEARYTFTSHGGGLKQVELKEYVETVTCGADRKSTTNRLATLNRQASAPILALLGGEALQGDGIYKLTKTPAGVQAEKIHNGLHITKSFQIQSNYLIAFNASLANRQSQPLALPSQEWIVGTATQTNPSEDPTLLGVFWQSDSGPKHVDAGWFANRTLGCFPGTPRTHYLGGSTNVQWVATHNQFFATAVVALEPATEVGIVQTNLPPLTKEALAAYRGANPQPVGFQASIRFSEASLPPDHSLNRTFYLFAGPKEYNTLAKISNQLKNNLDHVMGFDSGFGGSVFGFFAKLLLLSMNGLHNWGLSYALTIIVITFIIKVLFWPLTIASTRSMKRMAALQPQMKALQEKYKDDPAKMNRKLMEFMKENRVNPMGGCLPMLLQIPVFIGFFTMVRTAIELRGAQFLWACDLSQPDTIFTIPGLNVPVNPMPLLMGVTMIWQARLTPVSPGMDPMQQKIMKYMPLMFLFLLYNYSAGLTLYWTVQNLLTITQMKLTRTKEEPAKPALVTTKPVAPASGPKKKK